MRGGKAKGFTSTGGVVSPPYSKKKLSSELTEVAKNCIAYGT